MANYLSKYSLVDISCFIGILITGGFTDSASQSVEFFSFQTNTSCLLPDLELPDKFFSHTLNGKLLCGGDPSASVTSIYPPLTCFTLTSAGWTQKSYSLIGERWDHTSWDVNGDVVLIGGNNSLRETEYVSSSNVAVTQTFSLKYDTK